MFNGIKKHLVLLISVSTMFSADIYAGMLEEVIVTAQKRNQSENDIGIAISTWTGNELRDMGVVSAEDMALRTPGLTVNESSATGVPLYTIRGVGFQDYSTGASSTVGIYFDQVAMPYTVMTRGLLFDAERVEVLKGPQGDLYGRNTTAGQINFISNKPSEEFEVGVNVGYSSYSTVDFEGFVNGSMGENAQGRIALKTIQSSEGWQKSVDGDDELGEKDVTALRASFNIELSEDANLLLVAHHVDDQSDNKANTAYDGREIGLAEFSAPYSAVAPYLASGETPPWYSTDDNEAAGWTNSYTSSITGTTFDLRPKRDNQLKGMSAHLDWDLGNVSLTSITAYNKFERVERNDWDGGQYNDSSNINTTDLSVFSQELQLSGSTDSVDWLVGAYYSTDEMEEYYHYFMSDSLYGGASLVFDIAPFKLNGTGILELDTKYQQETDSSAIFGHVEWQFTGALKLTVGGRYTKEQRDWSGCTYVADDNSLGSFNNVLFGTTLSAGSCGTIDDRPSSPTFILGLLGTPDANNGLAVFTDTIDTSRMMGKIGLDYTPSDNVLYYASISQAFKSGGFNGANSNTTTQLMPYDEEILTSYEIGAKATLLEGSMQLNAAVFSYDYKDKQEKDRVITLVGAISGLTNVDESSITGAEIDIQWLPTDGLRLAFGGAWLDTEIDQWQAVDAANSAWLVNTATFDASGSELPQAPSLSYTALIGYDTNITENLILGMALDLSYTDKTTGGVAPERATEDYTVINARLSISDASEKWKTLLWVRNVADEDYYASAFLGGNGPYVRSMGMPRTVGVSLSYSFD
ncbi:MAG: iron complex outermembrane receptor protein [Porticoccaceae bacterium]|jgi:iron complex outermembrane receptor protein|tara:strand:- start:9152 stop:11572 length:2421 start_codon:yes stop_codon:yes gene_type:complete